MSAVITVKNAAFSYRDGTEVFRDLSFSLHQGESLGLVGPNGSGKTTLLLGICGILSMTGEIEIMGKTVTGKNIKDLRKYISFVFQNPDDQLFMPTVYEDVAYGLDQLGYPSEEIPAIVNRALERVDMKGFDHHSSHHLSLGQKKRVCLATALARQSDILFFDEPTNELDPAGRREFMDFIRNTGASRIVVSHDLNLITEICQRVIILNDRRIQAEGEVPDILSNRELMEDNHLEVPYLLRK